MKHQRIALLSTLLMTVLCGCAPMAQRVAGSRAAEVAYTVERVQRDLAVDDSVRTIRIVNPHGNVAIRNTPQRKVGVRAVIQRIGEVPESPDVALLTQGEAVLLAITYPSDRARGSDAIGRTHRQGRVDLAVFVPPAVRLEVETTYGKIDIRRVDNDVIARTRDGALVAAATGFLRLISDSGEIRAWPMRGKASDGFELRTRSGNIVTDVPLYGEIALAARTRGRIDSDIEPELLRARRNDFNEATHAVAGGTQRFDVSSETGDIYLQGASRAPTEQ